jgi:Ni/Co efflux regulator RcnB
VKKFIIAAVAASLVGTPLLAAAPAFAAPAPQHRVTETNRTVVRHDGKKTVVVKRNVKQVPARQYRSDWKKGQRFDSRYARNYRQVDYRQHRNLKAPPRGYRYVQSGNDAVLVGITSGVIAAVLAGALR